MLFVQEIDHGCNADEIKGQQSGTRNASLLIHAGKSGTHSFCEHSARVTSLVKIMAFG